MWPEIWRLLGDSPRVSDSPGVHFMPCGIAMEADHAPEAQRWNEEPSAAHDHAPSLVQAPPAMAEVEEPEELPLEDPDDAAVAAGTGWTTAVEAASAGAAEEADAAPVAKTPGRTEDAAFEPERAGAGAESAAPDGTAALLAV